MVDIFLSTRPAARLFFLSPSLFFFLTGKLLTALGQQKLEAKTFSAEGDLIIPRTLGDSTGTPLGGTANSRRPRRGHSGGTGHNG